MTEYERLSEEMRIGKYLFERKANFFDAVRHRISVENDGTAKTGSPVRDEII
jgi:hypothetical protein